MSTDGPAGGVVRLAEVSDVPLSVDAVLAAVGDPAAGGTTLFVGTVRDHDEQRTVQALRYLGHPTAEDRLRAVLDGVAERHDVHALAAVHRVGDLVVGDLAVVVAAAASHRGTAFDACRDAIDTLKQEVPIWKEQVFDDGGSEWVGSP
ncbi:molybdenum cofactor biosynthesis protein MoaE [Angustibacter aerolatus]|uniref:Molybdopterin biosynthesis protein MoeE n=1 Tax=Angustibacter aerolatus TaxID=1162965 RepID=A0ABQ6JP58_9ACTN|nr:molybdenum cofactor biosynthesis protein MoaE [Angustibacter aerolatus]GMA88510.1 molybdopterin biosynthesis protein MoeE [Angustibacter aerolatus]